MYTYKCSMRQCFSNPPITCEINYVVTRILSDKIEQNKIKRTRKEIQFITHSKGENYPIKYLFHTYVFVCVLGHRTKISSTYNKKCENIQGIP